MNALEKLVDEALERRGSDRAGLAEALGTTEGVLRAALGDPDRLGVEDCMTLASELGLTMEEVGAAAYESSRLKAEQDGPRDEG